MLVYVFLFLHRSCPDVLSWENKLLPSQLPFDFIFIADIPFYVHFDPATQVLIKSIFAKRKHWTDRHFRVILFILEIINVFWYKHSTVFATFRFYFLESYNNDPETLDKEVDMDLRYIVSGHTPKDYA